MEKALALSTFLSLCVPLVDSVDSIFANPKLKISKFSLPAGTPAHETTKKMPSSSRNTSDSWVKKATGLSPGSMAPLSSAVNAAASAYGVGVLVFWGRSFPRKREMCKCVGEEKQRTHFSAVAILNFMRGFRRCCCHHIARAGKRREREREERDDSLSISLHLRSRRIHLGSKRTRFLSPPADIYVFLALSFVSVFSPFFSSFLGGELWVLCASD